MAVRREEDQGDASKVVDSPVPSFALPDSVITTGEPETGVTVTKLPLGLPIELGVDDNPSVMVITVTWFDGIETELLAGGTVTTTGEPDTGVTVKTIPLALLESEETGNTAAVVVADGVLDKSVGRSESLVNVTTTGEPDGGVTVRTTVPRLLSQRVEMPSRLVADLSSGIVTTIGEPDGRVTVMTVPLALPVNDAPLAVLDRVVRVDAGTVIVTIDAALDEAVAATALVSNTPVSPGV